MKADVLAAGEGTRLYPLTATRPKPLIPVGKKPLIEHALGAAEPHVDGYVVVVGYRGEKVREAVGNEFAGKDVTYVEQTEQRGTAHAVARARTEVDDRFLVLNGDVVFDESLVASLAGVDGHAVATMLVDEPSNYGVVPVEDGELAKLVEKPNEPPTDEAAKIPVILHALQETEEYRRQEYDYVVDIDATAPLRIVMDIENCFQVALDDGVSNAYTVTKAEKNPYFNMVELDDEGYAHLSKELPEGVVRRQEAPDVYAMNASVYVYERDFLVGTDSVHGERTKMSKMPQERSVDIDTPLDLRFVEFLMEYDNA